MEKIKKTGQVQVDNIKKGDFRMKKVTFLLIIFFVNFLLGYQGPFNKKISEMKTKIDKMIWQTNITKKQIDYIKEAIKDEKILYYEGFFKLIVSHDLVVLVNDIQLLKNKWEYFKNRRIFLLNYLDSKSKTNFIKNKLKKKLKNDDKWENNSYVKPPREYFRNMLHSILLSKQIRYNRINKKYSEHLIKDILPKIKYKQYGIDKSYQKWLAHKAKAKKENWKIADENGQ